MQRKRTICRAGQGAALVLAGLLSVATTGRAQAQDIYEQEEAAPPAGTVAPEDAPVAPEDAPAAPEDVPQPGAEAVPSDAGEPSNQELAAAPPPQPLLLQPIGYEQAVAEAKSRRLSGILLFSIGTGLGLATAATAMTFYIGCSAFADSSCREKARMAGLVGLGVTAVSIAVGVPLWVSGQRELSALRRQRSLVGQLQLSPLPGGVAFGGRWQF